MYEFTKDCMIGIKEIDDEHKKLFDMINDAIALADKTEDVTYIAKNLIKGLKDYAAVHFAHEEAYMKKINDPELDSQIKEHKVFTEKVNSFKLDTSSNETTKKSLNDILVYIVQWLYKHILGSDIMIGNLLSTQMKTKMTTRLPLQTSIKLTFHLLMTNTAIFLR